MANRYVVKIDGDDKGFRNSIKDVQGRLGGLKNHVLNLRGLFAGLAGAFTFKGVLEATIRQENAMRQLEQRVRSTGGAAGFTAPQLAGMAGELQKLTTYGDEAVMEMQALLLTFTNIRGPQFQAAQAAVLDMATAMGTDLKSAALQLGKAMNDPVKGVSALSEAGVQFSQSQRDTIKRLVETGRTAEAQGLILKELEVQFGGAAAAAADTFGGALTQLGNAFGDLMEADDGLPAAKAQMQELTALIQDPATQNAFDSLASAIIKVAAAATEGVIELANFGKQIAANVADITGGLTELDRLEAEIADVDRALRNSVFGKPIKYLLTSEEELNAIRERLVAEKEALLAAQGSVPSRTAASPASVLPMPTPGSTGATLTEKEFEAAVKASEEAVKKENAEYQKWLETQRQAAEQVKETVDPTYELTQRMADLDRLLAMGLITWDEWGAATLDTQTRMDELIAGVDSGKDALGEFAEFGAQAARNMQSAFADFLFDPFKEGLAGMLDAFGQTIRRMIAEAVSAQILRSLFSGLAAGGGGGVFATLAANVRHGGGLAGMGGFRTVPALAFAGAPRFHTGGIAGGEVPAILRKGEGVFTPEQMRALGGGGGTDVQVHNYGPTDGVQVSRRRGPSGREQVDVVVRESVSRQLGNGSLDRALSRNAGTSRPGVKR